METLEPFNIIYQTAEDGLGDTVKPRLIEADADLERVLDIDSNKPFAIVLPINAGTITFYDVNGNTVEYWNNSL